MYQHIPTEPLTDEELHNAEPHVKAWYLRVYTLMHNHYASWSLAVAAVQDADKEQNNASA